MLKRQWVNKYRPSDFDQYVFQNPEHKEKIKEYLDTNTIPHLLLSGSPGTGKTSLVELLINTLDFDSECDLLEINASDNNSVDDIRDTVTTFAKTSPLGTFKIIHLKEADYLTHNAQGALRDVMEQYEGHCRFILTCNKYHKMDSSIKSRCYTMDFKYPNRNDIADRLVNILVTEDIVPDLEIIDKYIDNSYPDIRNIIMNMENGILNGELTEPGTGLVVQEYLLLLTEHIENNRWLEARAVACANVAIEEWESVYRYLYENIQNSPKFKDVAKYEQAIVMIAEHLYKHALVADPEINAAALFIRLGNIA